MRRIFFLWLSLLISLGYLLFPDVYDREGQVILFDFFPFSDQLLGRNFHAWTIGEHLSGGGVAVAIYVVLTETKYTWCAWTFFTIQVVDTVDYLLTYSEPWGLNPSITFNTMKCLIFAVVMFLDWKSHVGTIKRY